MDRRGEKVVSVYWFAILFIVAGAVVYMVGVYYGEPYDVREIEGDVMINKIFYCLDELSNFKDINLKEDCNLNFEVEDSFGWNHDQFYVEITFENYRGSYILPHPIFFGNSDLKNLYFLGLDRDLLPVLRVREFYLENGNLPLNVKTEVYVRKLEKNA